MQRFVLNGKQFRQLLAGESIYLGDAEVMLGELGFEVIEVVPRPKPLNRPTSNLLHLLKRNP